MAKSEVFHLCYCCRTIMVKENEVGREGFEIVVPAMNFLHTFENACAPV